MGNVFRTKSTTVIKPQTPSKLPVGPPQNDLAPHSIRKPEFKVGPHCASSRRTCQTPAIPLCVSLLSSLQFSDTLNQGTLFPPQNSTFTALCTAPARHGKPIQSNLRSKECRQ